MRAQHDGSVVGQPSSGGGFDVLASILARLATLPASRAAFWATAGAAVLLHWLAPRLPMLDLPQHAGQVQLWKELILGMSPWADLMWVNLSTPYLLPYALVLPLSFVMPTAIALALVLSAAALAFIAAGVALRKAVDADPRLDWLALTSFFGFAWQWGFFPFLVAAPLVPVFVLATYRHLARGTLASAAVIVALGIILLMAHGIAFMFACAVGGAVVLANSRSIRSFIVSAIPFAILAALFIVFYFMSKGFDAPAGFDGIVYGTLPPLRLVVLFGFSHSYNGELVLLSTAALSVPFLMGLRPDWRAAIPFAVLVLWTLAVPFGVYAAVYLYERFGMFGLPFYALMFKRPSNEGRVGENLAAVFLVAAAWIGIAQMSGRITAFARETGDFENVLAAAKPGKRAMAIIAAYASEAGGHPRSYIQFSTWYQVEKQGLVDFNFANYGNMVVRYRATHMPATDFNFDWRSAEVDWHAHKARSYDYFFVRHAGQELPPGLMNNGECAIETVIKSGTWTLLERGACSR